jgi:NADH-quinone oxidoreductase subunit J
MGSPILFLILAAMAIGAGIGMIRSHNAIYSALYLILNMCVLAVFYLALNAPFLAMVQITVYAGAIMVLFLFVIMLLGAEQIGTESTPRDRIIPYSLGALMLVLLGYVATSGDSLISTASNAIDSSPEAVGLQMFQTYVFPFEVTSILLLVAVIGVVVLQVKRRRES